MRSIRFYLVFCFLLIMTVALGTVSIFSYRTARLSLLEKKRATKELLEQQHRDQTEAVREKLDKELVYHAYSLANMARMQWQWGRAGEQVYYTLGFLPSPASPVGGFAGLAWLVEGARSTPAGDMIRGSLGAAIDFDEDQVKFAGSQSAEFFQIETGWGVAWRSRSMKNNAFTPLERKNYRALPLYEPRFTEQEVEPGVLARLVTIKAPVSRFFHPPQPVRPATPRTNRTTARTSPPSFGKPAPRPPAATEGFEQTAPTILVRCGADISAREAALLTLDEELIGQIADLEIESDKTLADLRGRLLMLEGLTFAATVIGGLGLVRFGLSPLNRLSEAVSRVSERDFRLQLDEKHLPSELRPIVGRLTQTLEQLKRAFAREKQAAADISHDLRTPLAALLATTQVTLRKDRSPQEYRTALADCHESALQMSQLVERLLALARLDAGVDQLRVQEVDVAELANQCAALVRPLAAARGLRLDVHSKGPALVRTDAGKLREVLNNLLHNAIEYNRPEGSVDLSVVRENGHLQVQVKDTGIGIPESAHDRVFERFYRVDPARNVDGSHAGLGLAIVKGYVELIGGTIALSSQEAVGSTFTVSLSA